MKISTRWLARHVDLAGLSPRELADALTTHTAEVEGVEPFAPWLGEVVVGHVQEHAGHPAADRLSLCRVDVGASDLLQIVCGAANVAAGQRVAVARAGTTLPGELHIKKSKIRGVESQGMICSERELGLGEEQDGIWVLPPEATVGRPLDEALGTADWVLSIDNKSLTHRPDLWGHRGIAREIAAIHGKELLPLDLAPPATGSGPAYPVRVETQGCSRYLGLPIEGVRVERSPEWLRLLLLAVGQRPIDLLVDLSNFVMLDLGQPNHLFDLHALSGEGILVRDARPGERMKTLDGIERQLVPSDALICSGERPVALAGVMGGEGSKVAPGTDALLLEVASFHPARVRRTAARLGLRTDASARFEKHLDPTLPPRAAAHLVNLLRAIQPGIRLPRPMGDAGSWHDPAREIVLRPDRVRSLLGTPVDDAEIARVLESLELRVRRERPERWQVAIPSERATKDLSIEEDLIEEVGRMHGYGRIAEEALRGVITPAPRDERRALVHALSQQLAGGARFHEALTYSFHERGLLETLGIAGEPHVELVNPQIEGLDRVRRSVLPSLLAHLARNRRQRSEIRLFEVGKGYRPEEANERGEPRERHELALVWALPRTPDGARFDAGALPRLHGVVADLLRVARRGLSFGAPLAPLPPWARPRRAIAAGAAGEEPVALLAELRPEIQRRLGLEGELDCEIACATLSLDLLLALPAEPPAYRPIPRFPGVKVDVALLVPEDCPAADCSEALHRAGKGLLDSLELFDLYRGPSLGPDKKSLAYHVLLQSDERTLTDQDTARFLARLERSLAELGGELRRE